MEFVLLTLLVFLGLTGFRLFRVVTRSRYVVGLLRDDRPDDFLREIDQDIAQARPRLRAMLEVNKSAGLCYVGRFEEALELLQGADMGRMPRQVRVLHANNLLMTLLHLNRLDEARRWHAQNQVLIESEVRHTELRSAVRGTLAIYEMLCGNRSKGEAELSELVKDSAPDYLRASRLYFLGRAQLEQGRRQEAEDCLRLAATLVPNSFVPAEFQRLGLAR